ncbi:MAG: molybdenum cofactor biosynthesis protein [Planctomycetota bacterium]|nr:MAG: molybdenum cofactor biosynthesis protein [Planctomycetota bacterium]
MASAAERSRPLVAAVLAIGNELLSGKVEDRNTRTCIAELRAVGTPVGEVRIVADELEAIARAVRELSARFDHVFTSGGVGPTHDDVTLPAIARAFGEPLVRHPRLEAAIRAYYRERTDEQLLRMADLPRSAVLLEAAGLAVPVVTVRNVVVLPGEPTIFRRKLAAIRERFRQSPIFLRRVFTRLDEAALARTLAELERTHGVSVGSYPRYDTEEYAVMVTIESREQDRVARALAALLSALPPEQVVRVDSGAPPQQVQQEPAAGAG